MDEFSCEKQLNRQYLSKLESDFLKQLKSSGYRKLVLKKIIADLDRLEATGTIRPNERTYLLIQLKAQIEGELERRKNSDLIILNRKYRIASRGRSTGPLEKLLELIKKALERKG